MSLENASENLLKKIRKEINEDVKTRDRDVEIIKEWLKKQPHLPDSYEDKRILNYLRSCKFSLEKCKKKFEMLFTLRGAIPEFFTDRDVSRPELQKIVKIGQAPPLPRLTPDGYRVTLLRTSIKDFEMPNPADVCKLCFMVVDVRMGLEEGTAGDIFILDASCLSMSHLSKVSPSTAKKFLTCWQEAYPCLVKGIHVVNISPLVETLVTLAKPLLSEKIRDRIHVHSNFEGLHKFVPKDVLPEEYGGTCGTIHDFHAEWLQKLQEWTPWFKEQERVKSDESKRQGQLTNYDELFGVEGSFKKLSID